MVLWWLHDNTSAFGKQRQWGSVGWGLASLATGKLADVAGIDVTLLLYPMVGAVLLGSLRWLVPPSLNMHGQSVDSPVQKPGHGVGKKGVGLPSASGLRQLLKQVLLHPPECMRICTNARLCLSQAPLVSLSTLKYVCTWLRRTPGVCMHMHMHPGPCAAGACMCVLWGHGGVLSVVLPATVPHQHPWGQVQPVLASPCNQRLMWRCVHPLICSPASVSCAICCTMSSTHLRSSAILGMMTGVQIVSEVCVFAVCPWLQSKLQVCQLSRLPLACMPACLE